ncbi:MAG: hypothetical protein JNK78_17625 [Planctomycetes bacterium]|nr:hypothetical protein [Planctomycetota bacterium]
MRVALFLTADRAGASALLAAARARWPGATFVAFANDEDRAALQMAAPGIEFRRDKPAGGKAAFVKSLRAERFDHVVVAWHGGERVQPLRVVALLLGAPVLVRDERGRETTVAWWQPWRWGPHLLRRAARTDALQFARAAAAAYRATVGALVAVVWIPLRLLIARLAVRSGRSA